MDFCTIFFSLSFQNIKNIKIQEKTRSKCAIGNKKKKKKSNSLELQLVFEPIISTTNTELIIHLKA